MAHSLKHFSLLHAGTCGYPHQPLHSTLGIDEDRTIVQTAAVWANPGLPNQLYAIRSRNAMIALRHRSERSLGRFLGFRLATGNDFIERLRKKMEEQWSFSEFRLGQREFPSRCLLNRRERDPMTLKPLCQEPSLADYAAPFSIFEEASTGNGRKEPKPYAVEIGRRRNSCACSHRWMRFCLAHVLCGCLDNTW